MHHHSSSLAVTSVTHCHSPARTIMYRHAQPRIPLTGTRSPFTSPPSLPASLLPTLPPIDSPSFLSSQPSFSLPISLSFLVAGYILSNNPFQMLCTYLIYVIFLNDIVKYCVQPIEHTDNLQTTWRCKFNHSYQGRKFSKQIQLIKKLTQFFVCTPHTV